MDKATEFVEDLIRVSVKPMHLHIDVDIVWAGNELVVRNGVFVDPNMQNSILPAEGLSAEHLVRRRAD